MAEINEIKQQIEDLSKKINITTRETQNLYKAINGLDDSFAKITLKDNEFLSHTKGYNQLVSQMRELKSILVDIIEQKNMLKSSKSISDSELKILQDMQKAYEKNVEAIQRLEEARHNFTNGEDIEKASRMISSLQEKNKQLFDPANMAAKGFSENMKRVIDEMKDIQSDSYNALHNLNAETDIYLDKQKEELYNEEKINRELENRTTIFQKYNKGIEFFKGGFSDLKGLFNELIGFTVEWEDSSYKTGRAIGFTNNQTQAYLKQTAKDVGDIGVKYGIEAKEIFAMQERLATATGKVIIMSQEQKNAFAATSKVFGNEITDATIAKMDNMGAGIVQTGDQLAKIQEGAGRMGINATKYAKDFTENLSLAQKYNFKEGLDSIRHMTELSEVLKINMKSIVSAADKMENVQGAIESSAKMQMLGGAFASNFVDPMRVMYESQSDPEALMKRVLNSVRGASTFNEKLGIAQTSYIGRAQMKAAAQNLGLNYDDLLQASQSEAKLQYLSNRMNGNLSESDKLAVANRAQKDSKGWGITFYNDKGEEVRKNLGEITSKDIANIKQTNDESNDINGNVFKIANILGKTFNDKTIGVRDAWQSQTFSTANAIKDITGKILDNITNLIKWLPGWLELLGAAIVSSSAISFLGRFGKLGQRARGSIRISKGLGSGGILGASSVKPLTAQAIEEKGISNIIGRSSTGQVFYREGNAIKGFSANTHKPIYGASFKNAYNKFLSETGAREGVQIGGNVGKSIFKKALPMGIGAALFGAYDIYDANNEANALRRNISYSSEGYRRDSGNKMAATISALTDIEKKRSEGIGQGIGGAIGGVLGSILGGIATGGLGGEVVGGVVGGVGGSMIGGEIGKFFSKKSSTIAYEEQSKDRGRRYLYETSKFGEGELNQYNAVGQATIKSADILSSIYQILASKDNAINNDFSKALNVDIVRKARGERAAKEEENSFKYSSWNPMNWNISKFLGFSNGGLVHANNGALIDGKYEQGDRELVAANSGEMILNKNQQYGLFSFIDKLYNSPTPILAKENSSFGYGDKSIDGKININLNGSIKLDAGGKKYNFDDIMKDPTFKRELVNMIMSEMNKNYGGKKDMNRTDHRIGSKDFRNYVYYN